MTTNGNGDLEVYPRCEAQLCVTDDKVQRKPGKKNLDGSSNTDGLKMKGCSSIQCLNKSFLLLNHLNIFAFLAFLEALLAFISYPTPAPSVITAIGDKLLSTALSGQQGAHHEWSCELPVLILPSPSYFPPFLK